MSYLKRCSSSFGRTNCICILLMDIRSSHRIPGSRHIQVPEMVSHMTSPRAWLCFLKRICVTTWQSHSMLANGFHAKGEESGTCLVLGNGWSPWPSAMIPLNVCTQYPRLVLSGQTSVPVHTLPTASTGEDPCPLPTGVYAVWEVCLRHGPQTA